MLRLLSPTAQKDQYLFSVRYNTLGEYLVSSKQRAELLAMIEASLYLQQEAPVCYRVSVYLRVPKTIAGYRAVKRNGHIHISSRTQEELACTQTFGLWQSFARS